MGTHAGSKIEVGPGTWRLKVVVGRNANGNPKQATATFHGGTRAADRELAAMVARAGQGQLVTTTVTLGALLDRYVDHAESMGRSPTTIRKYREIATRKVPEDLRRVKLPKLTAAHLDALYGELTAHGNAPTTVRRVHALIAVSLHQGQKWGLVVTNVADMASPPPVRTQEPTPPTWEQVVAIIKEAEAADPMFAELFTMAALTGARRGELCGLRWSDWDRDAGTVTIERSVYEVKGGGFGIKGTKSHGRRVVTLDATAVAALSRRWGVATDLTDSYGAVLDDDAYIFTVHPNGSEPIRPDVVTGRFTTAARAAGVDTHLHMLRHWAATEMIGAGVPVPVAAKRLGHKDSSVTLRIYSHALPAQDAEAAALLGSRLAGRKRLPA